MPESPLTQNDYTWLRNTVYQKLCEAQQSLPNNWRFKIYEGFRSVKVQQMLFNQQYQKFQEQFPGKGREELFYKTTQLVSPVVNLDMALLIFPPITQGLLLI